eukprot:3731202-Rhodomonas_salina.1
MRQTSNHRAEHASAVSALLVQRLGARYPVSTIAKARASRKPSASPRLLLSTLDFLPPRLPIFPPSQLSSPKLRLLVT